MMDKEYFDALKKIIVIIVVIFFVVVILAFLSGVITGYTKAFEN